MAPRPPRNKRIPLAPTVFDEPKTTAISPQQKQKKKGETGGAESKDRLPGSPVVPHYMERHMTFYPVTPREMRDLSFFNSISVAFGATGSFFFSTAIACFIAGAFADQTKLPEVARALEYLGTPAFAILALVCWGAAAWALWKRSADISEIQAESKEITATIRIQTTQGNP